MTESPTSAGAAGREGLTSQQAAERLALEGRNELPAQRRRSDLSLLFEVLREPMLALLLVGATAYSLLGDPADAIALGVAALLVILLTFVQARRAEHALYALRELTTPSATVVRDGRRMQIDGRDVVRGDWLLIEEGDRIAADGVLRSCSALSVDESLLTGESLAVAKSTTESRVFAGTTVVTGRGAAEVTATGARSELGRIGTALRDIEEPRSPMQQEIRRAVLWFGGIGFVACVLLVLVYALWRSDPLGGVLSGIALGMAMIPEEFPVVATVMLALGGHRLARQNVLTRRLTAIETLGSVNVLCVDKTGTLTENRMRVENALGPDAPALRRAARWASDAQSADPIDTAILEYTANEADAATSAGEAAEPILTGMARGRWYGQPDGRRQAFVKGAPEVLLAASNLEPAERERWLALAQEQASAGRRLLAVACTDARLAPPAPAASAAAAAAALPDALSLLGLIVLSDPVRAGARAALDECRHAGVRVVVITGDHPATARRVADEVGLDPDGELLTGDELDALDDAALDARLSRLSICARVRPEHKLRLVRRLAAQRAVVAMTGDGVNDAPALRAAHVGVALGGRGTDVAREASDLVLTDDRFETLVSGVREGRRVFVNLQHAVTYIAAVHVPTAGVTLIAALAGLPPVLLPIHIACLELLIDPACTLVFEAERPPADLMRRPPRRSGLFDRRLVWTGLLQGLIVLLAVLGVIALGYRAGASADELRSLTFASIVLSNAALLLANRSRSDPLRTTLGRPNPALWFIAGGGALLAWLVTAWSPLASVFHTTPLATPIWLALLAGAAASTVVLQAVHLVMRRRQYEAR